MQERTLETQQPASMTDETARSTAVPSPRHDELAQLASTIGSSARMTAQREQFAHLKGVSTPSHGKKEKVPLQGKFGGAHAAAGAVSRPANRTGLPAQLKHGIEALSGMSMDHVRVHYNSSHPSQLDAYAYAQGSDIHLAPGQERHLPHEAWHLVQQAQGRVKPTRQMKNGCELNDEVDLEGEADTMGSRALGAGRRWGLNIDTGAAHAFSGPVGRVAQAATKITYTSKKINLGGDDLIVGHKMEAELDVNDPVIGTATGVQWQWTRDMRMKYKGAGVVRGHLLNHDLGGQAIPANLYPISTQANAEHSSKVEQPVKHLLNTVGNKSTPDSATAAKGDDAMADDIIHYHVRVQEKKAGDPGDASFHCDFWIDETKKVTQVIHSNLAKDQQRYVPGASLMPGMEKIMPHPNWAHKDRHARDDQWVKNLKAKQRYFHVGLDYAVPDQSEWPEETNMPTHDFKSLYDLFASGHKRLEVNVGPARYRLDQEVVKKYLLGDGNFSSTLLMAAEQMMIEPAIGEWLLGALEEAAEEVPATHLPKSYQKKNQI